ncbi:lipoprotein [Lacticaseibacillus thailandensis]|uniref:Lipoprotein n=1 Tax=Lacticaseibacillus thailandensis DSM 22698 = JCM 13996 TaxID=1423810 RepID=A0A0R2C9W2_9LACO|nr:hypothetical protein [Lacticaseibacillus thailandensis]KRM88165.1 hypothetical protein FD19_GL000455 [Lacticaseibacillus thailandensis DSM 22698 = JCM 13996]
MKKIVTASIALLCIATLSACGQTSTSQQASSHSHVARKNTTRKKASSSSSSSSVSSSSSSAVDPAKSKQELKSVVTDAMPMDQWQTFQSDLLTAAQVDDIAHPEEQASITKFHTRLNNISKLMKEAKPDKREQKFMTAADYATYVNYESKLHDYLSALHDYAMTYQSDMPSLSDSNTDADTAADLKSEVNDAKSTFDTANAAWVAAYNAIANS